MDAAQKIMELEAELAKLKTNPSDEPLRLDFGCGTRKREGFKGVDIRKFDGVDFVLNVATEKWPWEDNSVDEGHASHFIEHLTWPQRVHFFNELGRVLKKGGKATLIWPHWCSDRYYGDPTHQAPISPFAMFYLNQEWRKVNAPHDDFASNTEHLWNEYTCDFDNVISFSTDGALGGRNQEFLQFAMRYYKEAAQDVMVTLIKR